MTEKPIYIQLSEKLIDFIHSELKAGEYLPSERKLAEEYHISRTTVRLAIQQLESLGYIQTIPGKGSAVSKNFQNAINIGGMYSFTEHMQWLGRIPKTVIIDTKLIEADYELSESMSIELASPVIYLYRLRLADNIPMMVERTYLPSRLFPKLEEKSLSERALYDILREDYQTRVKQAEEEIFASVVDKESAVYLEITKGSPALNIFRKTYSMKNDVIEYTQSVARGDKFSYRMIHSNQSK